LIGLVSKNGRCRSENDLAAGGVSAVGSVAGEAGIEVTMCRRWERDSIFVVTV
jgi:hypothetical protein